MPHAFHLSRRGKSCKELDVKESFLLFQKRLPDYF